MAENRSKVNEVVQAQIEEARRANNRELALFDRDLDEIPDQIFELQQLEVLKLLGTRVRVVPERIRELRKLKRLDLTGCPIERVPDIHGLILDWEAYLRCRPSLSAENVSGIRVIVETERGGADVSELVSDLKKMPALRELTISAKNPYVPILTPKAIADLIESLGELSSLEDLRLWALRLEKAPAGIRRLKRLSSLTLGNAGLDSLPDWLPELARLEWLDLSQNPFLELPEVIFRIEYLTGLLIGSRGDGGIRHIPRDILRLTYLTYLRVISDHIETPPPEVVGKGAEAVKNYWRQQQEAGVDYLCEAKLLIVGEAGAGKTSLARKLQDRSYKLQPAETSTEGIEIIRWGFPAAIRIKQDGVEKLINHDFQVNVWDFGGQEVYHATHQFFLTRRSLYLLVADDRKEDTDFNYWLNVVELLSQGSPVLIVQNEKQDRWRDINLSSLRGRFASLKESYRVNLADNRGLDDLTAAIRREMESLSHIGTPLPSTWRRVRKALEKQSRNYISSEQYLAICRQHGFQRREDMLQLSGYLHDLGICLHFQEDPVLRKTIILKPKWGTDAVYRVLDDRTILEQRGRFSPADLARIWSEDEYVEMRDELLRLMMKFQLCYELPEGGAYIAPQLRSPTQPDYDWNAKDNLVLRYEYDFMPKGLITRFIVAQNRLIPGQGLVWKSGVILERNGTRAEVIEDYARRKISVRVSGPDTRGLLAIVDDQLERIHAFFPHLKYEKFVPCNCPLCRTKPEPYAYPLTDLKDFAMNGDLIQCRTSRKLVDAAELIRDVLPSALRPPDLQPRFEAEVSKEVFVSYAWTGESKTIVDQIQKALDASGIAFVRDKDEIMYKDSIREFMHRIGRGKAVVVVLSKRYLESKNCMFELTEIAECDKIRDRVFPIILPDADIYDAETRLDYVAYWEKKKSNLDAKQKAVGGENLSGIREDLDLYAKIRATIAKIMDILGDMNGMSNVEELIRALEVRLAD